MNDLIKIQYKAEHLVSFGDAKLQHSTQLYETLTYL